MENGGYEDEEQWARAFVASSLPVREDWVSDTRDFLDPYGDAHDPTERHAALRDADDRLAAEIEKWQLEDDERRYAALMRRSSDLEPSDELPPGKARPTGEERR